MSDAIPPVSPFDEVPDDENHPPSAPGLVGHVTALGVLMIVQGALELLMAAVWAFVSVSPFAPARSPLNVVVLLTDSVALPVSAAGLAIVMALPVRASGSGPPRKEIAFANVTALVAWRTPLDRATGPVPSELLLAIWSEPVVPCGLDSPRRDEKSGGGVASKRTGRRGAGQRCK